MCARLFSRGFRGRRQEPDEANRLPSGQYLVQDFPVLTAGPTPRTPLDKWSFAIDGEVDAPKPVDLGGVPRAAEGDDH